MTFSLFIERSASRQSFALAEDGAEDGAAAGARVGAKVGARVVRETVLEGAGLRGGDWVLAARNFVSGAGLCDGDCAAAARDLEFGAGLSRIVCGTGPGSFAGVRAALAFAQGYSIGSGCRAEGLPSPCAFAREGRKIAAVGDARRGSFWVALYDGFVPAREIFAVGEGDLADSVPDGFSVVTPDAERIDGILSRVFGPRYSGCAVPLAGDLARAALANPSLVARDPAPVYLHPAVRPV